MGPIVAASSSLPPKLVMKRVGPARASGLRDRDLDEDDLKEQQLTHSKQLSTNRLRFKTDSINTNRPLLDLLLGLDRAA